MCGATTTDLAEDLAVLAQDGYALDEERDALFALRCRAEDVRDGRVRTLHRGRVERGVGDGYAVLER